MKRLIATLSLSLSLLVAPLAATRAHADVLEEVPSEPEIKAKPSVKKLLGKHALTLQWVESKKKGAIEIWQDGGYLRLKGQSDDADTKRIMKAITKLLPPEARVRHEPTDAELAATLPPGYTGDPRGEHARRPGKDR